MRVHDKMGNMKEEDNLENTDTVGNITMDSTIKTNEMHIS